MLNNAELRTDLALLPPAARRPAAFQSSDPSATAFMVATVPSSTAAPASPATPNRAVRMLGRYQLLRLLGKSAQTMLWLAQDSEGDVEVMLAMPRARPWTPRRR